MNDEQVQKIKELIEDHEKRIFKLENGVCEKKVKVNYDDNKESKGSGILYDSIKNIFDKNFFNEEKIDLDVILELQRRLLTQKKPLRASVANVLRRMVREELLERIEIVRAGKKLIAYKKL